MLKNEKKKKKEKRKKKKKKNSTGKFPPYVLQMHPKNVLHTQARFANNTHLSNPLRQKVELGERHDSGGSQSGRLLQ